MKNQLSPWADILQPKAFVVYSLTGWESTSYIDQTLPTDAKKPGTIRAGDLMLYGDDCVVLFYKTFRSSYSYTKIGHIHKITGMVDLLGSGNIKVSLKF